MLRLMVFSIVHITHYRLVMVSKSGIRGPPGPVWDFHFFLVLVQIGPGFLKISILILLVLDQSVLTRGSLLQAIGSWVGMPYTRGEMDLLAYEIANADGLDWWDTEYSYGCQKEIYTNISNTHYNDKFGTRFKTIITRLTTDNLLISIETLRNWIGLW